MGDFQQFEQDFYQSGYYVDDQGNTVSYSSDPYSAYSPEYQHECDPYSAPYSPEYQHEEMDDAAMPGVYDPSLGQAYHGHIYQPTMSPGTPGDAAGAAGYEDEPPLMEELGINFDHIWQKTLTVLNPFKPADGSIMNETDLTGPFLFCVALGATLLMAGKAHFGYIYGISAMGCTGLYSLLNLMCPLAVSFGCVASVLGYSLLPMVALAGSALFFSLQGYQGTLLAALVIAWCSLSASKIFISTLAMTDQQLLVAYPCALLYGVFALLTVF